MIGWLSGTVRFISPDSVTVDTGGVGYQVFVPANVIPSLGQAGNPVELFIHTHVREDAIVLYGFATKSDRELFLHLTTVSGVGPKTAMGMMSALPSDRIVQAIRGKNAALLQSVPGIGRKTAERMVVDLSDRLKTFRLSPSAEAASQGGPSTMADEVVSALLNLGYKHPQAEAAVAQVDLSNSRSFDTILKETLKYLAKS
ncbi:MAG: Holliday junction branch migration protein RuvA [Pseudomonadota bacterium]